MIKRVLIALLCLIEFIAIIAFMVFSALILFHGAILAAPIWAILWTILFFDVLWCITLRYFLKYRFIFSFISGFSVYYLLALLFILTMMESDKPKNGVILLVINSIIELGLIVYVFFFIKAKVRKISGIVKQAIQWKRSGR